MKMGWTTKWFCLACLGLSIILATAGLGQTTVEGGQTGSGSVVNRVQREDDPELNELIRIALANRKDMSEKERFEVVRKVTQSYAQIKLLDQQIDQLGRKIAGAGGPAEMRYELVLAKAELEAKRTTELASLRELMGVIPRYPFSPQPIKACNTSLRLNMVDQRIYVTDTQRPFADYWAMARFKSLGLLSESETLNLVRSRLKDKNNLPARIEVLYVVATKKAAEGLREAVVNAVCEVNAEMQTEVRLVLTDWLGSGTSTFFLRDRKITTLYPDPMKRPDGSDKLLVTGFVDPNDLEQHILWRLLHPGNVPLKLRIEYDEASSELAKRVADTAKAVAKRLGIAELVEVAGALVEPVPEGTFLGRWQADAHAAIQIIDIQPRGICQVTMGKGTEVIKAGVNVSGTWTPTTKEIFIDIKDKLEDKHHWVYSASVSPDGRLVVSRGIIYPQGSFHLSDTIQTIFKR